MLFRSAYSGSRLHSCSGDADAIWRDARGRGYADAHVDFHGFYRADPCSAGLRTGISYKDTRASSGKQGLSLCFVVIFMGTGGSHYRDFLRKREVEKESC